MGFVKDYNKYKKMYNKDEIKDYFYNHYYYIVDKFYIKNKGLISKEDIEFCLRQGIMDFINNENDNPSRYIHNRIKSLEYSYNSKKSKKEKYELLKKAFLGDMEARKKLFFKHADKIDKRIIDIYETYTDYDLALDSLGISLYQDMWNFINRYFDSDNKGCYFSTRFTNQLNSSTSKVMRNISKDINGKVKKKGKV